MTEDKNGIKMDFTSVKKSPEEINEPPINLKIEGLDAQVNRAIPDLSTYGSFDFLFKIALPATVIFGICMVIAEISMPGSAKRAYYEAHNMLGNLIMWLKYKAMYW